MIRQSFGKEQIQEALKEMSIGFQVTEQFSIVPSRRGSVAIISTEQGKVVIKYANKLAVETEGHIIPSRSEGLRNEAKQLLSLKRDIAPELINHSDDSTSIWIAMKHVPGSSLEQAAVSYEGTRKQRVTSLITAVGLLHAQEILHGDIQPGNAILESSGSVKLIDFEFGHGFDEPSIARGAQQYIANEAMDKPPTALDQSDEIFALMVSCLQILADEHPVKFSQRQSRFSMENLLPTDVDLAHKIGQFIVCKPTLRPGNADDLRHELAGYL